MDAGELPADPFAPESPHSSYRRRVGIAHAIRLESYITPIVLCSDLRLSYDVTCPLPFCFDRSAL